MRKRLLGLSAFGVLALIMFSSAMVDAQRQRPRPAAAPAAPVNLKLTYKMTAAGQTSESTTMIRGARQRSEMRMGFMDMVTVTQCDLKRTIQISDKARKYLITPMETVDAASPTPRDPATSNTAARPTTRGGVITYITGATDTGERKEMFGFQARHIKSSMSMESSPDACTPVHQRTETDGWYIDLSVDFNCDLGRPAVMSNPQVAPGGCRDRIAFKNTGAARTGFPLSETTTMYGPDGKVMFTSTREVVELSREPLDAALFDLPAGYTETQNSQELYVMPSVSEMTAQASQGRQIGGAESVSAMPAAVETKKPGTLRVGVVQINNKTERQVSTESLRQRLVGQIQGNGIEAVPLNAISAMEAETECKAKQCDFILYTDIAALKTSAAKKLGGMFGRVAGVGGIDKTESKLEFRLFAVGESSPRLQSGASAKEEGDEASAGTAIDQEARMVSAEVRKKK
jgi:hypothetical protein